MSTVLQCPRDSFPDRQPRSEDLRWSCFGDLILGPKPGPLSGHETGSFLRRPNIGCHFLGAEIVTRKRASFWDLKCGAAVVGCGMTTN